MVKYDPAFYVIGTLCIGFIHLICFYFVTHESFISKLRFCRSAGLYTFM